MKFRMGNLDKANSNMGNRSRMAKAVRNVLLAGVLATMAGGAVAAKKMPWQDDLFNQTSVEADIRDVLRRVLKMNGQGVIYRPGVAGEVTFEFTNMPLQAAFNKLIAENGLDYSYDKETEMVTIFPFQAQQQSRLFFTPQTMTLKELKDAVSRFDMEGDAEIIYDEETESLLITGGPEAVKSVGELIKELDLARFKKQQRDLELQKEQLAQKKEEMALAKELLEMKKVEKEVGDLVATEIKVIPLRFANVGKTTMTFMGEDVTVPGIDETLEALLGVTLSTEGQKGESKSVAARIPGGGATISIDVRTNSVIVRGTPSEIVEIQDVITRLDKPVPMVEIEVMVVEANDEASETLGMKWAAARRINGDSAWSMNSGVDGLAAGNSEETIKNVASTGTADAAQSVTDSPAVDGVHNMSSAYTDFIPSTTGAGVLGSIVFGAGNDFIQASIALLEQDGKAQTLASPRVVTLNNMTAQVTKTDTTNVQVANNSSGDVDIESISAGLSLEITPSVIPDEATGELSLIRLNLNAASSSLSGATIPGTTNDEMQTNVIIPDGATFMLGGLLKDTRSESHDGIPVLKDLPLVGSLFGSMSSTDSMRETIFFITPRIITQADLASGQGRATHNFVQQRREDLSEIRRDLRENSQLLDMKGQGLAALEEDE